jgi:hypothetical protein
LSAALALSCAVFACNDASRSDDGGEGVAAAKPELRAGESLGEPPACGVSGEACSAGLECATVDLSGGRTPAACVDHVAVCAKLQCARGSCGILETYPATITCLSGGN